MKDEPHIVVVGTPFDGFRFHGPFDSFDAASEWAESQGLPGNEWWAAALAPPDEEPRACDICGYRLTDYAPNERRCGACVNTYGDPMSGADAIYPEGAGA